MTLTILILYKHRTLCFLRQNIINLHVSSYNFRGGGTDGHNYNLFVGNALGNDDSWCAIGRLLRLIIYILVLKTGESNPPKSTTMVFFSKCDRFLSKRRRKCGAFWRIPAKLRSPLPSTVYRGAL